MLKDVTLFSNGQSNLLRSFTDSPQLGGALERLKKTKELINLINNQVNDLPNSWIPSYIGPNVAMVLMHVWYCDSTFHTQLAIFILLLGIQGTH